MAESQQKTSDRIGLLADFGVALSFSRLLTHVNHDFEILNELADLFAKVAGQPFLRVLELIPNTEKIGGREQIIVVANSSENINNAFGMR